MDEKANHLLVLALIAGLATADLSVAEQADSNTDQVPEADLKEFNDPTILSRRVWLETEWNKFTDGTHFVEETLGTLLAWPVSENQDFGVRLKLPVKFRVGSDDPNVSDIGGLGDIKVAAGTAFVLCKTVRIGGGLDLEMPTGRHELSDNAWRIQEFAALGWDITPWLTASSCGEFPMTPLLSIYYEDCKWIEPDNSSLISLGNSSRPVTTMILPLMVSVLLLAGCASDHTSEHRSAKQHPSDRPFFDSPDVESLH